MKYRGFLLSCFALLSGCALPSTVWQKPGVTQGQFSADSRECEAEGKQNNPAPGPTTGSNVKASYEKCMTELGYNKQGEAEQHTVKDLQPGVLAPATGR